MRVPRSGSRLLRALHRAALWAVVVGAGGTLVAAPSADADLPSGAWGAEWGLAVADDGEAAYVRAKGVYAVRKTTGGLARVERADAGPSAAPFPTVAGTVHVMEPDGAGGWLIGGTFRYVGGVRRRNLAHILPDGGVDPGFDPGGPTVTAIARSGSTVFVGAAPGEASQPVAAYDLRTGRAVPTWDPGLEGVAWDLEVAGDELYAAGELRSVGGANPRSVVQLDPRTGVRTTWDSGAVGSGGDLAVSGTTVYVSGGSVLTEPVTHRDVRLAAFDRATGRRTGWAPAVPSASSLDVAGDRVYLGRWSQSTGSGSTPAVLAVDAVSGAATDWAPGITGEVETVRVQDDRVVVGGSLSRGDAYDRRGAFAVSRATGEVLDWDPKVQGRVEAVAAAGTDVVLGGRFAGTTTPLAGVGGILRVLPDGTLDTDWRSPPMASMAGSRDVMAMEVAGDTLYAAGGDWVVGDRSVHGVAAFDLRTGGLKDFDPDIRGRVHAVVPSGDRLYLVGFFSGVAGADNRRGAAVVDRRTGELLPWDPDADEIPETAVSDGRRLYVGGRFRRIGGTARRGIAAFDLATARLDPTFAPTQVADVRTLAPFGDRLYLSGSVEDFPVPNAYAGLVALDTKDGSLLPWLPRVSDGGLSSIVPGADTVWVAGEFGRVDGVVRHGLAELDAATGRLRPERDTGVADNPPDQGPFALRRFAGRLLLAGAFTGVGPTPTGGVAVVDPEDPGPVSDDGPPSITVTAPYDGQHVPVGVIRPSAFSCSDPEGFPLAECSGPETYGSDEPRTTLPRFFARDRDGNQTSLVTSYVVDPPGTPPTDPPPTTTDPPPTTTDAPPTTTVPPPTTTAPTSTTPDQSEAAPGTAQGEPPTGDDPAGGRAPDPTWTGPPSVGPPPFALPPAFPAVPARPSVAAVRPSALRQLARAAADALRGSGRGPSARSVRTAVLPAGTVRVVVRAAGRRGPTLASGVARRTSAGRYAVRLRTSGRGLRALRRGPVRVAVTVVHVGATSVVTRVVSRTSLRR